MASLSLCTTTTTTITTNTHHSGGAPKIILNKTLFPKSSQFHIFAPKLVLCKASNTSIINESQKNESFGRRNMLISLGTFSGAATALTMVNTPASSAVDFPRVLDSVIRTKVARPQKARSEEEKAAEEEVIVVDVQVSHADARIAAFEVYINDGGDLHEDMTKFKKGYVGNFSALRHSPRHRGKMDTSVRLGLSSVINDLGADNDEDLEVSLVPRSGLNAIVIKDVRIEYIQN